MPFYSYIAYRIHISKGIPLMNQKRQKSPMSSERVFTVTMILTLAVAAVFFVKNLLGGSARGAVTIGICLVVFGAAVFLMKKLRAPASLQQMVLCVLLVFLVFFISLNSGEYYSDDFPLFLALIALTGLYLEPKTTLVQTAAIVAALVVMYVIHPEKAESLSQYIMCVAIFIIAALINFLVIRRGRAFIEVANQRAHEAEILLNSIQTTSDQLQQNYENSNRRVHEMAEINDRLEQDTSDLRRGSESVYTESGVVAASCSEMQETMQATGRGIESINTEVSNVGQALSDSRQHLRQMDGQIQSISDTIHSTVEVFSTLQQQMQSISSLSGQLSTIAFNTKLLAINASVEAARAGHHGAGFAVVANEVQTLAAESTTCSNQVTDVVNTIHHQIQATTQQLDESTQAIQTSLGTLNEMERSFDALIEQFQTLYENIQEQNSNISSMDAMFGHLHDKVSDMSTSSTENRAAVDSIVDAMNSYRAHMEQILDDTRQLHELSSSMLDLSGEQN